MRLQDKVFNAYKKHIEENMEENRQGALRAREALEHSPLNRDGVMDKTIHIPGVFDEETMAQFRKITAVTCRIFEKVMDAYRKDPAYRSLFPFSRELEDLILLPVPYKGSLPIARLDIFYDRDTGSFEFCEINTDGTAAMIRDLEMRRALIHNPAHQAVIREFDLEPFELFDSWVRTFMALYDTWDKKRENPRVALVDFLDNATISEFEEFVRAFQKAGVDCGICEIRDLRYENGTLLDGEGKRIDAVYRRAVTADIMARYEESGAFLDAVRENSVFVAGAFCTQIIHSKWIFYVLHHPMTEAFLTLEETAFIRAHVPLTMEFSPAFISLEEVRSSKDQWILKPMDAYASKGIYAAGKACSPSDWEEITADLYGRGYICQKYCRQYMTDNIDFAWGDGRWHPYINMPGLYTYNGTFSGILMRMACEENIIVAHENERTVPVFTVKGIRAGQDPAE